MCVCVCVKNGLLYVHIFAQTHAVHLPLPCFDCVCTFSWVLGSLFKCIPWPVFVLYFVLYVVVYVVLYVVVYVVLYVVVYVVLRVCVCKPQYTILVLVCARVTVLCVCCAVCVSHSGGVCLVTVFGCV